MIQISLQYLYNTEKPHLCSIFIIDIDHCSF